MADILKSSTSKCHEEYDKFIKDFKEAANVKA